MNENTYYGNDAFLVLHDVAYYGDIINHIPSTGVRSGVMNLMVYPRKPGTYPFFDENGSVVITNDGQAVTNVRGNASPYRHPVQPFKHGDSFSLPCRGGFLVFDPEREVEVGKDLYYV